MPPKAGTRRYKAGETVDLAGVEIFAAGVHNGDAYSVEDLEQMVRAAGQVGFEPPVKLGHMEEDDTAALLKHEGLPAFGWVRNLRVKGQKLLADFMEVPRKLADLIRTGRYRRVSAEIYWNYQKGKDVFPRVLKAVALLGAEIPAVTDLAAIEALYATYGLTARGKDEAGHEYRTYCPDMVGGGGLQLKDKDTVAYRLTDGTLERCGTCRFYLGNAELGAVGTCWLVHGEIAAEAICDLYEPREAYEFPGGMEGGEAGAAKDKNKKRAKAYMIEKRGDEWCLVSKSTGETLGCHPTEEEARAQEAAIKANAAPYAARLTLEQVRTLCAPCAERMEFLNLRELRIQYAPAAPATKRYQGFNQALCDAFGEPEGFRTRCMGSSTAAEVDDPGAFCNALKEFCFGTTASGEGQRAKVHGAGGDAAGNGDPPVGGAATMTLQELKEKHPDLVKAIHQEARAAVVTETAGKMATLEAQNATLEATVAEYKEKFAHVEARLQAVEDGRRKERIKLFVEDMVRQRRLTPAQRDTAVRDLEACDEGRTVAYTVDGKEIKKTQLEHRMEFYKAMPVLAHLQVQELSLGDGGGEGDAPTDPAKELETKIAEYQAKNGGPQKVDYRTAMDEVLRTNPELKKRYAGTRS